ncbi:MAG: hypothetical protein AAFW82_06490 [Pseudomonadota bacterium]
MTNATYGIRERAAMLALMALNREILNGELDAKYKLGLDKKQRERLNADGLIVSRKIGRGFAHELTDRGWAWVMRELEAPVPKRAGSAGGGLYAVLNGLAGALASHDMRLADLFGSPLSTRSSSLDERIRTVYRNQAKRAKDWIYLSDIRAQLTEVPKNEVDSVLLKMFLNKEIRLTLEEDQKSLTANQRAAAIRVGMNDMHLMSME